MLCMDPGTITVSVFMYVLKLLKFCPKYYITLCTVCFNMLYYGINYIHGYQNSVQIFILPTSVFITLQMRASDDILNKGNVI